MILTTHLLVGAAIASKMPQPTFLALVLAFLSHYLLDLLPHSEYLIKNIKGRRWHKSFLDFSKIGIDIGLGTLLILIFSKNAPIIFAAAFLAILPDAFTLLNSIWPNKVLKIHEDFHTKKIHFLKYKKISLFWRISSQILVLLAAIYFLLLP